jgi:hypothetical protein
MGKKSKTPSQPAPKKPKRAAPICRVDVLSAAAAKKPKNAEVSGPSRRPRKSRRDVVAAVDSESEESVMHQGDEHHDRANGDDSESDDGSETHSEEDGSSAAEDEDDGDHKEVDDEDSVPDEDMDPETLSRQRESLPGRKPPPKPRRTARMAVDNSLPGYIPVKKNVFLLFFLRF